MAEDELRQIATEYRRVFNPNLVFNKGAKDTPQRWMSAAREYVEAVQGPAAEARFAYSENPGATAIEIANDLDRGRLPGRRKLRKAAQARRRANGLIYASSGDAPLVPGASKAASGSPS